MIGRKKMKSKNKTVVIALSIILLAMAIFGVSYAYFTASIIGGGLGKIDASEDMKISVDYFHDAERNPNNTIPGTPPYVSGEDYAIDMISASDFLYILVGAKGFSDEENDYYDEEKEFSRNECLSDYYNCMSYSWMIKLNSLDNDSYVYNYFNYNAFLTLTPMYYEYQEYPENWAIYRNIAPISYEIEENDLEYFDGYSFGNYSINSDHESYSVDRQANPVMYLKEDVMLVEGDGSMENPYRISIK